MNSKSLTVTIPVRPYSLNAERTQHWSERASRTSEVRGWAKLAAISAMGSKGGPYFTAPVIVMVHPFALNRRYRQDVGNCYSSFKSALDGCVDAGVIVDDSDQYLSAVTFYAHQFGRDELTLTFSMGATSTQIW